MYNNYVKDRVKEIENVVGPFLRTHKLQIVSTRLANGDFEVGFKNSVSKTRSPVSIVFGGVDATGFKSAKWSAADLVTLIADDSGKLAPGKINIGIQFRLSPIFTILSFIGEQVNKHGSIPDQNLTTAPSAEIPQTLSETLKSRIASHKFSRSTKGKLPNGATRQIEPWAGLKPERINDFDSVFFDLGCKPFSVKFSLHYYRFYTLIDNALGPVAAIAISQTKRELLEVRRRGNKLEPDMEGRIEAFIAHNTNGHGYDTPPHQHEKKINWFDQYRTNPIGLTSGKLPDDYEHNGSLDLRGLRIEKLPSKMRVKGTVYADENTPLEAGMNIDSLVIRHTRTESLPEGLIINDHLDASFSDLRQLPSGLKLKFLDLYKCPITELPPGLEVDGLQIESTGITTIPDDAIIGGRHWKMSGEFMNKYGKPNRYYELLRLSTQEENSDFRPG